MDLRTRTSLFCGALAIAIAASVMLRGRSRQHVFVAGFAADMGFWYLAQSLYHAEGGDLWVRFTALLAVLLPQLALHLFEAILPLPERRSLLLQVAGALLIPMVVLVLSPLHTHPWVRAGVIVYVFGLIGAGLWALFLRGERGVSREMKRRVRFLSMSGALAAAASLADFLWFVDAPLPPVGAVLSIVFLFVLAESIARERLVDVYEMLGMVVISTPLAFALAGIFYLFVVLFGSQTVYLNAVLGAIVVLIIFEPLRDRVADYIHKVIVLERADLERAVTAARRELSNVLKIEEMGQVVGACLASSHRVTRAGLYLRDPLSPDFVRRSYFGPRSPERLDGASLRPFLEDLTAAPSILLEQVATEAARHRGLGEAVAADAKERVLGAAEQLGELNRGVVLAVRSRNQVLLGFLVVVDERVSDAFSTEDVALLESLAVQIGVVIDNSRQYSEMQAQERLVALGQMAAGLAHEIRNPLSAIKGAAQLLNEPGDGPGLDTVSLEFVGIITEEVERLDRVVNSVLNYARPSQGTAEAVDVNVVIQRTLQLLGPSLGGIDVALSLNEDLPKLGIDAERLRQVLINLLQNAAEAMGGEGAVRVSTQLVGAGGPMSRVEIAVSDEGPGISPAVGRNLFVPFATTKATGTGLGLAISQRVIREVGGDIEVVSRADEGATFTVLLPVVDGAGADTAVSDGRADRLP